MRQLTMVLGFAAASVLMIIAPVAAQTVDLPFGVVKDSSNAVMGPVLSLGGSVIVGLRDPGTGQPISLQFGPDRWRISNELDLYFTNADCTGTAYVEDPAALGNIMIKMAGKTYVAGPLNSPVSKEPDLIYSNKFAAGLGTDNSGLLNGHYKVGNVVAVPTCDTSVTSNDTIEAEVILNLSTWNPPFRLE